MTTSRRGMPLGRYSAVFAVADAYVFSVPMCRQACRRTEAVNRYRHAAEMGVRIRSGVRIRRLVTGKRAVVVYTSGVYAPGVASEYRGRLHRHLHRRPVAVVGSSMSRSCGSRGRC